MTSYQKLKVENAKLRRRINRMLDNPKALRVERENRKYWKQIEKALRALTK